MKFKGFIFDLDGTLIDSKLDFRQMRSDLGIDQEQSILEEIALWPLEKQKWAHEILDRHEWTGADLSTPYPGVYDFLQTLKDRQIPSAVFTRNSRMATQHAIHKHSFKFATVITRDDAPPKPDPTGLLIIAEKFKLPPQDILYIGDYLYDLKAGTAAGIATALFVSSPLDFPTLGAHFVFDHFNELQARSGLV